MPLPFSNASPAFYRDGDFYSGRIWIEMKEVYSNCPDIDKIKSQIPKKIKRKFKKQWAPLDKSGHGVILFQGQPIIIISKEGSGVQISIGRNGAVKRRLSTLEDFASDMITLQKVTETYIDSVISIAVKERVLPKNPDYTLIIS